MTPDDALWLSAILFAIGTFGVLVRRHVVVVLGSLWLLVCAVLVALAAAARGHADDAGHALGGIVLVVAVAELAIGLGVVTALFRARRSADVETASSLRW